MNYKKEFNYLNIFVKRLDGVQSANSDSMREVNSSQDSVSSKSDKIKMEIQRKQLEA